MVFSLDIFISTLEASMGKDQRRHKILKLIDEELFEVTRLNKQGGSRNARLLLRMAELLLEKARHVKEIENQKYLSVSPELRRKKSKRKYFTTSRKYFIQAQKTCHYILKRFKKLKNKGNIYYILAYNSKEFQKHKNAEKYFKLAIRNSKKGSEINARAKMSLAEIYYNQQKYSRAIPLYREALKKINDQWLTKDTYNLAWCYFRLKKYNKAISNLKKVYRLSKRDEYIDMSKQVERDLVYFYTESGKVKLAVEFYRKKGVGISKNLLKVSTYLLNQGKYSSAEKTLEQALKYNNSEKDLIAIHIQLLNLYDKFGKTGKHLKSAKILLALFEKKALSQNEFESLRFHVQTKAALLQKQAASKRYRTLRKTIKRKTSFAVQYFNILSKLNPSKKYLSEFNAAETNFNAKSFNKSAALYDTAYKGAKAVGNHKIAKLSLDGLLLSLGGKGVRKKTTNKYLMRAYLSFVKDRPNAKENYKILQRIFSLEMANKKIKKAEKTLYNFKSKFPRDYKTQEAMLAKIMDYYKEKNNKKQIIVWVKRINQGDFKVSKKYANKVRSLLLTMQFDDVENASTRGDKKTAMIGYLEIFKAEESSREAKKNAAYNIATLFHQVGYPEKTFLWSERALGLMSAKDVKKFESSFVTITTGLFNRRKFKRSAKLNELLFKKTCRSKSRNKRIFYKNANVIYLADHNFRKSDEIVSMASNCGIQNNLEDESIIEQIKYLIENKNWSMLEKKIFLYKKRKSLYGGLLYPMSILLKSYKASGREDKAERLENRILKRYSLVKNKSIELEALDAIANIKLKKLKKERDKLVSIQLSFPEKRYNQTLKNKFSQLDKLTSDSLKILESGSGEGIINSYKILVSSYEDLAQEIENFTPQGKSSEYVKGFKKSMKQLVRPIKKKTKDFRREALKQIMQSSILSSANGWFFKKGKIQVEYSYSKGSVLMDRGGYK